MSLLQDVLRPTNPRDVDLMANRLSKLSVPDDSPSPPRVASPALGTDSSDEDELIGVISTPGTPRRLQSRNTSRSTSPTREGRHGAASRRVPGPLHLSSLSQSSPSRPSSKPPKSKTDPVRVLTTDLVQRIFSTLSVKDLASCSRVCLKWNKSQSLNYIWFLQNRKLEFGDKSLPTGKWTRKESKENWRKNYMHTARTLAESDLNATSRYGYATPPTSSTGYSTPREIREEQWAQENGGTDGVSSKLEMREMYKELGGRKAKSKNKVGSGGGARDRGGWNGADD